MQRNAKKKGILVSYDSNYRSKLWSIDEAKEVLEEILNYVDFAFLGSLDMINILKFEDNSLDFDENYNIIMKCYLKNIQT